MKKLIFKKKFQVLFWLVLVAAAIVLPMVVFGYNTSDTGYKAVAGSELSGMIIANTSLKCNVANNAGVDYFIPTKTMGEWNNLKARGSALSLYISCCNRDGYCDDTIESCSSCPRDCGVCGTGSICGDGSCGAGENATNCPYDCTLGCCTGPGSCNSITIGVRCTKYPEEGCSWNGSAPRCYPFTYCGDNVCNGSENNSSCPQDCYVGDNRCNTASGENCSNDPQDCGACICGNGICDGSDTCANCPGDCGSCASGCQGGGYCSSYSTQFVCNKNASYGCYWVNAS